MFQKIALGVVSIFLILILFVLVALLVSECLNILFTFNSSGSLGFSSPKRTKNSKELKELKELWPVKIIGSGESPGKPKKSKTKKSKTKKSKTKKSKTKKSDIPLHSTQEYIDYMENGNKIPTDIALENWRLLVSQNEKNNKIYPLGNSAISEISKAPGSLGNFRIMSWNVHYSYPPGTTHNDIGIAKNDKNIIDIIREIQPTVVCLQEIQMDSMLARTLFDEYKYLVRANTGVQNLSNVIFSKLPLENTMKIPLGDNRYCVAGTIDTPNQKIEIYNTHLTVNGRDEERKKQLDTILQIAAKNNENAKIVLGDFNALPESETVKYALKAGFKDVWSLIKTPKISSLWGHIVDYILYFGNFGSSGSSKKHSKKIAAKLWYTDASDHLPLIVDFS